MKPLYLNRAGGIVDPQLTKLRVKNPSLLYRQFVGEMRSLLGLSMHDFLGFAQNATTSIIYALTPILKKNNPFKILVSSHEIRWYKDLFSLGRLPIGETTYPNYAGQRKVAFIKKSMTVFDPHAFIKNPQKFLPSHRPAIIVISHVSRLTGELFMTPKIYRIIKRMHKDNIVIVDGCQAVGAIFVRPQSMSDIYVGVTSKFIGAEPHIGFYWVRSSLAKKYGIKPKSINLQLFSRELYSAVHALRILRRTGMNISSIRSYFEKSLNKVHIPFLKMPAGQRHILLIPAKRKKLSQIIEILEKKGIIAASNTSYSIREPVNPALRISITPHMERKDVDYVVHALEELKSGLI